MKSPICFSCIYQPPNLAMQIFQHAIAIPYCTPVTPDIANAIGKATPVRKSAIAVKSSIVAAQASNIHPKRQLINSGAIKDQINPFVPGTSQPGNVPSEHHCSITVHLSCISSYDGKSICICSELDNFCADDSVA